MHAGRVVEIVASDRIEAARTPYAQKIFASAGGGGSSTGSGSTSSGSSSESSGDIGTGDGSGSSGSIGDIGAGDGTVGGSGDGMGSREGGIRVLQSQVEGSADGLKKLPLVTVDNLSFRYHQREIFSDLNFEVFTGRTTAIVGPTGSGKTTLAHILAGLLGPTGGSVIWTDSQRPPRKRIQMVFQSPASTFDPRFNVGQSLNEAMLLNRKTDPMYNDLDFRRVQIERSLDQVGLSSDFNSRKLTTLSGGEVQRAALARVLLFAPEVIVLDESLVGLDSITVQQIVALLKDLQRQTKVAYLFISHNFELVRAMLN
jgi:peptide/nickel transport system ATP-binding protein